MNIDNLRPIVLNVGKAIHNADWNWQNVCSPFIRIYYVCSGEASVLFKNGKTLCLRPGNLYLIPAFTVHTNICIGPFVHYYVHVYEDGKVEEQSELDTYDYPLEIPAFEHDGFLFKRLTELNPMLKLAESNPDTYDDNHTLLHNITVNKNRPISLKIETRGIVYMILSRFLCDATPRHISIDTRIDDSVRYIRTHLSSSIVVEDLASRACLSADHFIRLFKQTMNCTPMQYVNTKRIEKAQLMLYSKDTSIKNIAFELGFDDVSYFTRVFKRIAGVTPNEYRNGVKN